MTDNDNNKNSGDSSGSEDAHPDRIGPYRILDVLGEGGMAIVYLAEQTEPVKRQVALKIIKPGMDSKQVVGRFESERQALAVLDHPNIATVFDGGIADNGRPWFAMELVRGVPITDYCDQHRLTTRERIELFRDVCVAVQHAHHKGLIHRDLKPTNLLVGVVDEKPQVKIIDFGIAKATSTTLTDQTLFTKIGQVIGTPQYMSPEQANITGLDVDSRTDIYSLGVVLYEILVGALPLNLAAIGEQAIKHALLEVDPPRPSTRITELGDTIDEVARARRTSVDSLRRQLSGDLDWVVMRAIEKDRTRRYETANALAMDCVRYLKRQPVVARPPSAAYVVRRFVQRNRVMVVAACIAMIAVIGGAVAATLGLIRATEAEQVALREAAVANRVSEFLTELFQVSDPSEARGNSITAREILDRGADSIEEGLGDQPDVQAALMSTMGQVYQNLGLMQDAERLLERALDLRRGQSGIGSKPFADVLQQLAQLNIYQQDLENAETYNVEALRILRALYGDLHENIGRGLTGLATIEYYRGNYQEAANLFADALEVFSQTVAEDHPDLIDTTGSLAVLHSRLGDYEESVRLSKIALDLKRRKFGDDHPDVAVLMGNIAINLKNQGKTEEAREYYLQSLEMQQRQLGTHRLVANTMNNIGMFMLESNELDGAEQMFLDAIEMWSETLGPDNSKVFIGKSNLGQLYLAMNELEKAESQFLEARDGQAAILGESHERVGVIDLYLGEVYLYTGRVDEAERRINRAAQVFVRNLANDHPRVLAGDIRLGALQIVKGDIEGGIAAIEDRLERISARDPGSLAEERSRYWVARFLERVGLSSEASRFRD